MRPSSADVLIIGGGVVGAATARALAKRGVSVVLIEKGSLSVAQGSSRGTARIFAPAPYPDRSYLDMGLRAVEQWQELERESGASLLVMSGALYAGSGLEAFAKDWDDAGIRHEELSGADAEARFGVRGLGPEPILFQREAGVIRADTAHQALVQSAAAAGAELREDERATSIEPGSDGALVHTSRGTWKCSRVIVVAGPWTRDLVEPLGLDLPLAVTAQLVAYFKPPPSSETLPAVMELDGDEPYALPDPARWLKAALHTRGQPAAPDDPWELDDPDARETLSKWVAARFPGLSPEPVGTETCLYTNTSDERFLFGELGAVTVCSACSGHGFQFAPRTGDLLAERIQSAVSG